MQRVCVLICDGHSLVQTGLVFLVVVVVVVMVAHTDTSPN